MNYVMRSTVADADISGPPVNSAPTDEKPPLLTACEGDLVRATFKFHIEPNLEQHAIILFLTLFDISDSRNLFSYVRDSDEPAPLNARLQAHATAAFRMMCEAIMRMDDAEAVERKVAPQFRALGARHLGYGVGADDTPVFRTAFLKAMARACGNEWKGAVESAWSKGFDVIEYVVCQGMDK
eukprot:TRINITY_DN14975_c0_g1_i1.p1 TRINITY_DN14975_c0_g1~~TRINITY_DN14975_c0_g1_i1.p1  ORF type:complete len:182 (-),score=0.14 TRINITY_DN14975_c0_g1_i1:87-632(-)